MKSISPIIGATLRRAAYRFNQSWMALAVAAWWVGVGSRAVGTWLRNLSPAQTLATIAVAVITVAPSAMYIKERTAHHKLQERFVSLRATDAAELATLHNTITYLMDEQADLRAKLLDHGYTVVSGGEVALNVVATGYSSTPWQTDDTPFITASNTSVRHGIVALSRDMLQRYDDDAPFRFGDTVHITGIGNYEIEDSMNRRWRKRLDIWFENSAAAREFGKRTVTITAQLFPTAPATPTPNRFREAAGSGDVAFRGTTDAVALPR